MERGAEAVSDRTIASEFVGYSNGADPLLQTLLRLSSIIYHFVRKLKSSILAPISFLMDSPSHTNAKS